MQGGYLIKASLFQLAALQGRPMQVFGSCNAEPDAEVSLLVLVMYPVVYNVISPAAYIIHPDYSLHCDRIWDYSFDVFSMSQDYITPLMS